MNLLTAKKQYQHVMKSKKFTINKSTKYENLPFPSYIRENYKAWVISLPQKKVFQMLADSCEDSELELKSWDKETLAEFMCIIKYGKEKD